MGLRDLRKKLTTSVDELDDQRLQHRFEGLGLVRIHDVEPRRPVKVGGEVHRMRIQPRSGVPAAEVSISDGTGTMVAIFTGRRRLPGLEQTRAVIMEGMPFVEHGRLVLLNPAYTLLPH